MPIHLLNKNFKLVSTKCFCHKTLYYVTTTNTYTNDMVCFFNYYFSLSHKCVCCVFQTGLSGNIMILSVLYKGGLLMASQHMTVGELSSFLLYTFWVGISIAGNIHKHTLSKQCTFPSYDYCVPVL